MGHWFAGTFLHEHCKIHLSIALGPAFPFYFTFSCIAPLARCSVEFGYGVEYFGGWRRVGNDFLTEAWSLQRMRFVLNAATAPVPSEPRAEVSSPGDTAALCHGPGEQRCIVLVRLWWLWQGVKKALLKRTRGYILKSPWNHFATCKASPRFLPDFRRHTCKTQDVPFTPKPH